MFYKSLSKKERKFNAIVTALPNPQETMRVTDSIYQISASRAP